MRPAASGYVHGDCHSRNIMLTGDATAATMVDIEILTGAADYMLDYGLLLEDLAVYQSLPYGREPGCLRWEDIRLHRPEPGGDEVSAGGITYPAFPAASDAVVHFQRQLLEHLAAHAATHRDRNWKRRLWLATARGLLLLAARQLTSHTLQPRRRAEVGLLNDHKLVQMACAEAVRLLHELCERLDSNEKMLLPDMSFSGRPRA